MQACALKDSRSALFDGLSRGGRDFRGLSNQQVPVMRV